jgi:hypothetical protein
MPEPKYLTAAEILERDLDGESSLGEARCVGDRFLCRTNSLVSRVRRTFLSRRGQLVPAESRAAALYNAAPLLALNHVLASKTVASYERLIDSRINESHGTYPSTPSLALLRDRTQTNRFTARGAGKAGACGLPLT